MPRKPALTVMLCSDARNGRKLNPSACQTCISPCEYGKQWLTQLGMPLPEETKNPIFPKDMPELRTTYKQIQYRRYKSYIAQRS